MTYITYVSIKTLTCKYECRTTLSYSSFLVELHSISRCFAELALLIERPHHESINVDRSSFELLISSCSLQAVHNI